MATDAPQIPCSLNDGCGTVRVLAERVRTCVDDIHDLRAEDQQLHARITDMLKDKVIEYRWVIGLTAVMIVNLALTIIGMLKK